ncbi:MAG: chorismate mutase [Gammaproteobacteria bacterium]|nr:chorismate mutase [Gammaproteobacteria bacterium]MDP2139893.1 chorismate mutase [Gammaproteobacteria bacterium]MDP2347713.1 chorismate mutase [Gammaproteobacteria bacterium]
MASEPIPAELLLVREQIDRIDHGLVLLLANRFALTRRVGELKAEHGLQALDPERESRKLADIRAVCAKHGVNQDLVAEILERVMREVVKNHKLIQEQQSAQ